MLESALYESAVCVDVAVEPEIQFDRLGLQAKHVVVYLLPAAFRVNAVRVPIPRLTCGDTQLTWRLERCLSDGVSSLLWPKCVMQQRISHLRVVSKVSKVVGGTLFQKSSATP